MRLHECYVCVSLIIFNISLFLFEFRFMLREERKFWNQLGFDGVNGVELTLWCLVNYTRSIFFQSLKKKIEISSRDLDSDHISTGLV